MTYNELNQGQKEYVAAAYVDMLNTESGEGTSYYEMAYPFSVVTEQEVADYYEGTNFTEGDFPEDLNEPTPTTDRVCFRTFDDGEVIALFPHIITDCIRYLCQSYMHIGQHADASLDLLHELRHATEEEYTPLLNELTAIGYNIVVDDRYPIGTTL